MTNEEISKNIQTVLGFDYGLARIGVAVGQSLTGSASAIKTISARDGKPNWEMITALFEVWKPDAIVVGIPYNMDGSPSFMTSRAQRFARQLHGRYNKPVYNTDERLSSIEARNLQQNNSKLTLTRLKKTDRVAACLIIEQWFNEFKS